jgi:hypothetical protein
VLTIGLAFRAVGAFIALVAPVIAVHCCRAIGSAKRVA